MQVRINETGNSGQSSGVQLQVAGVAYAHAHNETLAVDGDVRHFEFSGGQMENSGVFDDQMRFACASRSGNSFTEVHEMVSWLLEEAFFQYNQREYIFPGADQNML